MRVPVVSLMVLLLTGCGGAVKKRVRMDIPPAHSLAKTASLQQLVELVNERYAAAHSLSVSDLKVKFKSESRGEGYVEEYRSANGYLVVQEPDSIFVNILNPLTKSTLVAMGAQGQEFQMWIPRENKYLTGKIDVQLEEDNPLYNVRPNHFLKGILVEEIPVHGRQHRYFLEETQDPRFKYYVIGIVDVVGDSGVVELTRKLWIERSTLHLVRQHYYERGKLISVIDYNQPVEVGGVLVNTTVEIDRKRESYSISFELAEGSIKLNPPIKEGTFQVIRPPGSILQVVEGAHPDQATGERSPPDG